MAHLWSQSADGGWSAVPLDGDVAALTEGLGPAAFAQKRNHAGEVEAHCARVLLVPRGNSDALTWILVAAAGAGIYVNARPLVLGICVLNDKDEIRMSSGRRCFFSTEQKASIETYARTVPASAMCPRCKQEILVGAPIVRCPGCGIAHHQKEQSLPCWTGYERDPFETCALCEEPTGLGAAYRWTPDTL